MSFFWRFVPGRSLLSMPTLRWLVISRFFSNLFFYSTTLVLFQQQRGLNFTEMFLMEAILSASIWLADVPTSIWSERIGYARMILLGRAIGLVGILVFALAHGFWLFACAEVLGGVAFACVSGCENALIYASLPAHERSKQGGEAFALLASASSAGFFLGLMTGSFLGAVSSSLAVMVSIIPTLLAFLAAFRIWRYAPVAITVEDSEPVQVRQVLRRAWKTVRSQPVLALLSLWGSVNFALTNAVFWYNQPYLQRVGIPVVLFGPLTAAALGLQLLILLRLAAIHRLLGTRLLLACSCFFPGLCYLLLPWVASNWLLTLLLIAGVIVFSAWQEPVVAQEVNGRIADTARATTLSALSLVGSLGKSTLDPLIGRLGDSGLAWVGTGLGGALLLLSIVALLLPLQSRRQVK